MSGGIMKILIGFAALTLALISVSCGDTGPAESLTGKTIMLSEYGSYIDQGYYKVWSDSSREMFGQITTIGGTTYATVIDGDGYEHFYSSEGYAGFIPSGGSLILFDSPVPSLPDTLTFGKTYDQAATFTYAGIPDTLKIEQTLVDTGSVIVPFGTFSPCVHFKQKSTFSGGGQSSVNTSEFWLAKGPSDIKRLTSGTVTLMVRGYVNGQSWGEGIPKRSASSRPELKIRLLENFIHPLLRE
jgi:hypothetical protein